MKQGIYKITNINNNQVYIGRSSDIEKRWQEHKNALITGTHHSYKLQECYDALENKDDLKYEIIEEIEYEGERIVKEQYYMDKYNAYHNGYNCCEFADNPKYIAPAKEDIRNFVFLASWYEIIDAYEKSDQPEMAGEISKAIISYGVTGEIISDNPLIIGIVKGMCAELIDKSKDRYVKSIANGKKGGRPKQFSNDQIISLHNQGMSDKDIAEKLGCAVRTVQRAIAKQGGDEDEI